MGWFDDNPFPDGGSRAQQQAWEQEAQRHNGEGPLFQQAPVPRGIPSGEMGSAQRGPIDDGKQNWFPQPDGTWADAGGNRLPPPPNIGNTGIVPPNVAAGGYQPSAGGAQDPQAFFNSLFPGSTLTPEQLAAAESQLQAQGIRLLGPNARGQRTKIELPNGQVIDVIGGAGAGHNTKQWLGTGGGGGAQGGPGGVPLGAIGAGAGMAGGTLASREAAHAGSPGYQFIVGEAMRALENSASARGTLLTGGHMRDLQDRAAGLASTDFGNEFNRNLQLGQLGFNAANAQGGYGSSYGTNLTSLTTGIGNAQAAGTANQGAAVGGMLGNLGNLAIQGGIYRGLGGQNQGGGQSGAPVQYGWNGLPTR